ncbi:DNA mismatch repair protein MutL [subsurface metagenome]
MGQIVVLDQNMVNMIAAGEVIERPASVVKELMENSIDAGATKITVSVEDGGRKLISVTDNGCGMDGDDLTKAFEPHTTSKIKTSSDLWGISTLGFRGEALASIGSVAQVRTVSRPVPSTALRTGLERSEGTKDSVQANCIEIDCGNKSSVSPSSADFGTTIQVRDIFYKLPARRKFLRTANTEMTHITEHFTRIALANGNLDLTLISNEREIYRLLGNQGLRHRIAELFPMLSVGTSENNFIEGESNEKGLHIFALLGKPGISRTSGKFQYIFLNGRFIRDKFISHAIKEAYRGLLELNRFPVVFLFIQMPYEDYDVNVHPTKIEVRFYNSNLVHSQILGCIREKLLGTNLEARANLSAIPHQKSTFSGSALVRDQKITDAMAEFFKKHRPVQTQQQFGRPLEKPFAAPHPGAGQITESRPGHPAPGISLGQRRFLQIHDSFIVAQTDDGFVIIDQHALHERIIYEALCRRMQKGKLESQRLLIPESFELTEAQGDILESNAELIEKLGIELVPFGPKTMAIQAFPTLLAKAEPCDFVQDLIDLLEHRDAGADAERLLDEIMNMAACKAAIKAGQKLTDSEIEQLLADKENAESPSRCPHGRPTTIKFSISDLEKQFKRT